MHVCFVRRVDDVGFDHQIFVNKFGGVGIVRVDSAHFGSGQVDLVEAVVLEEVSYFRLREKIQLAAVSSDECVIRVLAELANQRRADHSPVPGNEDFGLSCGHGR